MDIITYLEVNVKNTTYWNLWDISKVIRHLQPQIPKKKSIWQKALKIAPKHRKNMQTTCRKIVLKSHK